MKIKGLLIGSVFAMGILLLGACGNSKGVATTKSRPVTMTSSSSDGETVLKRDADLFGSKSKSGERYVWFGGMCKDSVEQTALDLAKKRALDLVVDSIGNMAQVVAKDLGVAEGDKVYGILMEHWGNIGKRVQAQCGMCLKAVEYGLNTKLYNAMVKMDLAGIELARIEEEVGEARVMELSKEEKKIYKKVNKEIVDRLLHLK